MLFVPRDNSIGPDRQHVVCRTNDLLLPDFTDSRRAPTRPPQFRGENFDLQFDATTLFYDAVDLGDGEAVLLAPPFFNLADKLSATIFAADGGPCRATIRNCDRHAQVWLKGVGGNEIRGKGPLGDFRCTLSPKQVGIFRDRRVIFTMSKDNRIEWILDWVRFNRDVHGADAVLLYDNGSTTYDCATLSSALRSVAGIACSVVVEWPYRYGPQGTNSRNHWDSDFCQLGAWEHARWRFLAEARSAMNSDVDELVLSRNGQSVFETAEQSRSGFVRYHGRWIIGVDARTEDVGDGLPRHSDFSILMPPEYGFSWLSGRRDLNRCASKWTVVPAKCPQGVQWHVHSIASWLPSYLPCSRNFSFSHFREIGSNWKYQRTNRVTFDPAIHIGNRLLVATFARVDWKA